ncbi:DUF547 domain-containing protein [Idiomarina seosinensis]|uniref:DUF547 domain-containing protein n=1 Tax=Idiomarina seosinensis TaxID=281739 RepID=UPI001F543F86|nr:DUF547 domain-containing protein [Idiomarina seosinensis]
MLRLITGVLVAIWAVTSAAQSFDHSHQAFTEVLEKHVEVYDNNFKSVVDYQALSERRGPLDSYLNSLSEVTNAEYNRWNDQQQLSFLINAYNAFTLQLIIDNQQQFASGEADSIRDLGGFFSTPWEKSFFKLLDKERTLDWLEHEKIRVDFDEPRIHAALVCAAISCPKLRSTAFQAKKLDDQLENQMVLFLSDRDKNGIDQHGLYLSKIFDWYKEDFNGLHQYMQQYGQALADNSKELDRLRNQPLPISYTDYNWALNSSSRL